MRRTLDEKAGLSLVVSEANRDEGGGVAGSERSEETCDRILVRAHLSTGFYRPGCLNFSRFFRCSLYDIWQHVSRILQPVLGV